MNKSKTNLGNPREAGAIGGKNKRGAKYAQKKTVAKKFILENPEWKSITDAEVALLMFWQRMLLCGTKEEKIIAAKEISKFVFTQKRENTVNVKATQIDVSKLSDDDLAHLSNIFKRARITSEEKGTS